jgi:hypothetical protein
LSGRYMHMKQTAIFRGTSERKSAQIRKEEKARMAELSAQMSTHTNKCPVCLVPKEG